MRIPIGLLALLALHLCGCSSHPPASPPSSGEHAIAWPKDWSAHLGKTVTVEGTAGNAKVGAFVEGKNGMIWIDGLGSWPEGYYTADRGKRVRVTGTVIKKDDLPVFVAKPDQPAPQGIPVNSEEERERAKWRYLLKDATWKALD
jgi:hypothetical protein